MEARKKEGPLIEYGQNTYEITETETMFTWCEEFCTQWDPRDEIEVVKCLYYGSYLQSIII